MQEFDKFAKNYDTSLDDILQSSFGTSSDYFAKYKVNIVHQKLQKKQKLNILDFGCGVGKNTFLLEKLFPNSNIYGIDVSEVSIEIAKKQNNNRCEFVSYDGSNINFEDNFFDIIFISNVFHHIDHSLHKNILVSLKNKLSKDGLIFFFEHNTLNPVTLKIVNECEFDKDAKLINFWYAKKIFKDAGFDSIQTNFILFIPPSFKFLLFLEKYLKWLPFGAQYYIIARKNDF